MVMTNVTARPMLTLVSTLLDTPRKGQQPRKRLKMKLWVRMQLTINSRISVMLMRPVPPYLRVCFQTF